MLVFSFTDAIKLYLPMQNVRLSTVGHTLRSSMSVMHRIGVQPNEADAEFCRSVMSASPCKWQNKDSSLALRQQMLSRTHHCKPAQITEKLKVVWYCSSPFHKMQFSFPFS